MRFLCRKPLDQRFAVLLMRSSYDAVDHLDFVPRHLFEANFWKLRQSELEGYNYLYNPLKMRQGDLTGRWPLYTARVCRDKAYVVLPQLHLMLQ